MYISAFETEPARVNLFTVFDEFRPSDAGTVRSVVGR